MCIHKHRISPAVFFPVMPEKIAERVISAGISMCRLVIKTQYLIRMAYLGKGFIPKSPLSVINITITVGNYSDIEFFPSPYSSYLYFYGNGTTCPNDWGLIEKDNVIFFHPADGLVTLYWIPTNEIIEHWDFT